MEITIKNNKLNYEILKKNGKYFFPSSFVLIFKLVSLYYIVLILISIFGIDLSYGQYLLYR